MLIVRRKDSEAVLITSHGGRLRMIVGTKDGVTVKLVFDGSRDDFLIDRESAGFGRIDVFSLSTLARNESKFQIRDKQSGHVLRVITEMPADVVSSLYLEGDFSRFEFSHVKGTRTSTAAA